MKNILGSWQKSESFPVQMLMKKHSLSLQEDQYPKTVFMTAFFIEKQVCKTTKTFKT
jgi:hypothetical protein